MAEEIKEQSNTESQSEPSGAAGSESEALQHPSDAETDVKTEKSVPDDGKADAKIEKSVPDDAKADVRTEKRAPDDGKTDVKAENAAYAKPLKTKADAENAAVAEEKTKEPVIDPGNSEEDDDTAFFDDDDDDDLSEKPSFHFRFPKVRILTRKIAEQEKLRKEAGEGSNTDAGQEQEITPVSDEERIIWIPARLVTFVLIIAVVLAAALAVIFGNIYWKYSGYEVVNTKKQEDTLSAEYCRAGDNILRYSTDGASLLGQSGSVIWDVSYSMNDPQVSECDNVIAIYDKDGTNIVVCDVSGQIGSASTSLPIIRAKVCDSGAVAALQQDSSNAYIEYYDKSGEQIALIKTSMDNPGFPLDFALSNDGKNIAVSYLGYVDSKQTGILRFYNFGTAGQSQMDNRIADFQYTGVIIPQLEYLDAQTCVAFRSDGFSVYTGSASVKESTTVSVSENIQSVFHDASRIGMIVNDSSSGDFDLLVYNTDGREILNKEFNFAYKSAEFSGDDISLYNGADLCVFNLYGVEKFNGSYSETPQSIFSTGRNRYVVVRENSLDMVRLK